VKQPPGVLAQFACGHLTRLNEQELNSIDSRGRPHGLCEICAKIFYAMHADANSRPSAWTAVVRFIDEPGLPG